MSFEKKTTWAQAEVDCEILCTFLGDGWRLPTMEELELICEILHNNNLGDFQELIGYWSSKEHDKSKAWIYVFVDGFSTISDKTDNRFLRPVRTVNESSSSNLSESSLKQEPKKLTDKELVSKAVEIMKNAVSQNFNGKMFEDWMIKRFELKIENDKESSCPHYMIFEDYNMVEAHQANDLCSFFTETIDNAWNEFMWDVELEYNEDDDEYEEEYQRHYGSYIGVLDFWEMKYFRINGFGDCYDYDAEDLKEDDPDWSEDWFIKDNS